MLARESEGIYCTESLFWDTVRRRSVFGEIPVWFRSAPLISRVAILSNAVPEASLSWIISRPPDDGNHLTSTGQYESDFRPSPVQPC